ncbi:MAG: efflux RND transporter periplasmic adaptor subunit [Pirellulales bacterium]
MKPWRWLLTALAPVVGLLWLTGCTHEEDGLSADLPPKPVSVTVGIAEKRQQELAIDVVGSLKGWEEVQLGSKKSGRVVQTLHDVGDRVAAGEPLVKLETINAELAVEQAQRRLETELAQLGLTRPPTADFDVHSIPTVVQAQIALERAKKSFARIRELHSRNVSTIEAFDNAEFEVKERQAALDAAVLNARATLASANASQVELEVARQALDDLEIRAPQPSHSPPGVAGPVTYAVTKRLVAEGQMIREGDSVAELTIENPLRLWAPVPERFSPYIAEGQPARIHVASHPDRSFPGAVAWVNPAVDPDSRTFQVEVSVPNDEQLLRPGGFAKLSIVIRKEPRLMVPTESIVRFAGVTKLFVVADGKVQAVPVEAGFEADGLVEIEGAVPVGAHVVTSGQSQLADGSEVVVRERPGTEQQTEQNTNDDERPAGVERAGDEARSRPAGRRSSSAAAAQNHSIY